MSSLHRLKLAFRDQIWPWASVVGVIAFLSYLPTLGHQFVWDDRAVFEENESVRSWASLPRFFSDPSTFNGINFQGAGAYRPILSICYLVEYKLHGVHAGYMHLFSALLHGCNAAIATVLMFLLIVLFNGSDSRISWPRVAAAAGGLVYAIHPLSTEAVCWIKCRDDLLCTLFYLSACCLIARGIAKGFTALGIATIAALYLSALLSKEMAISLPVFAICLIAFTRSSFRSLFDFHRLMLIAVLVGISIGYLIIRTALLRTVGQVPWLTGSFSAMMATMTRAITHYVSLTVWPFYPNYLNADYAGFPLSAKWSEPHVLFSTGFLVLVIVLQLVLLKVNRLAAFGMLFWILALLPVLNIVPTMQVMAERFTYLPLAGWGVILAAVLNRALASRGAPVAMAAFLLYVAGLTVATQRRIPVWQNELSLFTDTYLRDPDNPRAAANYGHSLLASGAKQDALDIAQRALANAPGDSQLIRLQAKTLAALGNTTGALTALELATQIVPERVSGDWIELGTALASAGDFAEAIRCFNKAAKAQPESPTPWFNLAVAHLRIGDLENARNAITSFQTTRSKRVNHSIKESLGPARK